jgi:general secretion pathway protein D
VRNGLPASMDPSTRLFVHRLRHAKAEEIERTLRAAFGLAERATTGFPSDAGSLSEQLRRQRIPPYDPGAAPAPAPTGGTGPQTVTGLAAGLTAPAQIVADAATNSLLIRATAADYEVLRSAIDQLDERPLQVIIEVLIAEVRRDRQLDLGFDVAISDQPIRDGRATIGGELAGRAAGDIELRILGVGGVQADILIRALAAATNVSVLSRPVVLAQNNQEARILVGSQRPFVQVSRSLPTDGAIRDQVVQYRDVGTRLRIRPTINPDGYVTLQVLQEVSSATAETQFGAPVISTREVETQLLVKDGQTVVLGGLVDRVQESVRSGIPILQSIPLLVVLFRSTQSRRGTTELFVFLTPRVLRTDEDLMDATRQIESGTRLLRRAVREPSLLEPRPEAPAPPGAEVDR